MQNAIASCQLTRSIGRHPWLETSGRVEQAATRPRVGARAMPASVMAVTAWTVEQAGITVTAFVKAKAGVAWTVAKRHVTSGKVFVDGERVTTIDHRIAVGQQVEL